MASRPGLQARTAPGGAHAGARQELRSPAAPWASAILANAAMSITSPRAVGSTPAARRQRSASAALPAQPASAARSVLRRWAKAASITAKTCSRVAVVTGGSRRVKATSPEWILGAGQKTFMPITPALRMLLYQAALTDGTP